MCNARTVLPLWAVVVPVNVCNATRYGVRGQRYDNSVYHDGPFVPQGGFKVHTVVSFPDDRVAVRRRMNKDICPLPPPSPTHPLPFYRYLIIARVDTLTTSRAVHQL